MEVLKAHALQSYIPKFSGSSLKKPIHKRKLVKEHAYPNTLAEMKFITNIENALGKGIGTGEFGANMQVELVNDGPVTIFIDSKRKE